MKKVFLTGGTGFFGKSLLESGVLNDVELTVLSRDPAAFAAAYPEFVSCRYLQGDVRTFSLPKESFDWIIHGATTASPDIDDAETRSVMLDGTKHMLDFAHHCGVQKFLYISSGAVYGPQPPELYGIPETFEPHPVSVYGKSKYESEQLCLESDVPAVIVRGFAFSGKYLPRSAHFALGNFLDDVLHDRPVVVRGDGRNFRSYLDAADLCTALRVLLDSGTVGEAYNVGSARAVSIRELASMVIHLSGKNLPLHVLGTPAPGLPSRYVPDVTKLQKLCGETVPLERSIRQILEGAVR